MTCRHERICDASNLLAGVWSTMRRCLDCWEVLPMGPARDDAAAMQGWLAALAASTEPVHERYYLGICMQACVSGWFGVPMDDRADWASDCEDLSFAIRDASKKEACLDVEVWAAQYVRWGPAECMVPAEASDEEWSTVLALVDAIREQEKD